MTFDEWLDAEYPDRADRHGKFRMSSVRDLMVAAWEAGQMVEREACAKLAEADDSDPGSSAVGMTIATAIRARSES